MTVLCANCHTANRDRAMFCRGCAGKMPAFAATGPSALETASAPLLAAGTAAPPASAARRTAPTPHATTRPLMLAVLLLGATVLALAAWISFGPERSATPGIASAAPTTATTAPPPLTPLATPTVVPTAPIIAAAPPTQVPVEAALSPGESTVPTNAARSPAVPVESIEPAPRNAPATRAAQPQRVAAAGGSNGASDPRAGCEHLFFVLAARCEASHCNEAAYTRHPRCTVVREQRRQDEARRNLTSGY